jgi:hypothetical protein
MKRVLLSVQYGRSKVPPVVQMDGQMAKQRVLELVMRCMLSVVLTGPRKALRCRDRCRGCDVMWCDRQRGDARHGMTHGPSQVTDIGHYPLSRFCSALHCTCYSPSHNRFIKRSVEMSENFRNCNAGDVK